MFGPRRVTICKGITPAIWKRQFQRRLAEAYPELGNDVFLYTPHTCRTGGACEAIKKGVDIDTVRQMLSHKSLDSTKIYTKASREKLALAFSN